jgi:glycosyltransferase involved in cell wall biosynthesis
MISVCIATYNGEKYIKEQLDSIINQLDKNDEIIISDDGSSDNTIKIIESYNDSRIVLYKNSFKNVVCNFEFAIDKSTGDYIFLSDQDDIWHKDKVKYFMDCFLKNSNVTLLISDFQIIDENGLNLDGVYNKNEFSTSLVKNVICNNFIGCAMAFTSYAKNVIMPFPKNIAMHDWWIGTCSKMYGEIIFIDKKLHFYRRHNSNLTTEVGARVSIKIKWRLNLIVNLIIRYFKINLNKSIR